MSFTIILLRIVGTPLAYYLLPRQLSVLRLRRLARQAAFARQKYFAALLSFPRRSAVIATSSRFEADAAFRFQIDMRPLSVPTICLHANSPLIAARVIYGAISRLLATAMLAFNVPESACLYTLYLSLSIDIELPPDARPLSFSAYADKYPLPHFTFLHFERRFPRARGFKR